MLNGSFYNSSTGGVTVRLRWGTGTAPIHGAALVGTTVGTFVNYSVSVSGNRIPCAVSGIVTGLVPGTTYWLDASYGINTAVGTGFLDNVQIIAMEF
jgi:hypothetical protein